jgi:hypothetical protein
MSTPEGRIKTAVKKALNSCGAYHHWPVQNGMGAPCLDCHGCYKGIYFAIETKAKGKLPTFRQNCTIQSIRDAGGFVLVVDNKELAERIPDLLERAYRDHVTSIAGKW